MTDILIVPFRRKLAPAFQRLNLAWIERLFEVEEADRKVLGDPERAIRLYERLGFCHAADPGPPEYARADVYMELPIDRSGS
jgi:hypothetical protein